MPQDESVNTAAQEYYCRLTTAGAALEAAAKASGKPVVLTHVAVGDGNGEVPVPEAAASALVHEVYRREIDGKRQDEEDPNIAWLHIIIPADEGGFWIREFGIYAAPLEENGAPVLYAYGNHAPYYKQQSGQGQATTHELSIPIVMSGTAEVEISIKDAGYASQLALDDLAALVAAERKRLWENEGEGPLILPGVLPENALTESRIGRGLAMQPGEDDGPALLAADLATQEAPGIVQPDGVTTQVDEAGILSALGGNLLLNAEAWITESGEWEAPVSGWYSVFLIGGGDGGTAAANIAGSWLAYGGKSGGYKHALIYLNAGEIVPVTIGAAGLGRALGSDAAPSYGGATVFGELTTADAPRLPPSESTNETASTYVQVSSWGGGFGAGRGGHIGSLAVGFFHAPGSNATFYGGGGGAYSNKNGHCTAGNGKQGAVRVRWHDPANAGGPAPALFSARRMAPRAAAEPAVVNLYDPETGQGSVWREEDVEARLAEGLITQEAWLERCTAKAAEERAAWLANPDTEAERFEMLRAACEAKLAETDKLVQPDYPISAESRAEVVAYRQAIRELNHLPGAPWDGGGEGTPWPEQPVVEKAGDA